MLNIKLICVGKLKEKFYIDASSEYMKRLSSYCKIEIDELPEVRRSQSPSAGEIEASLLKEAELIKSKLPSRSMIVAMCIEGGQMDSVQFSSLLEDAAASGISRITFIIGGSDGLHPSIKALADKKLSMSKMTFPHHLARVMLLEQIYRGFKINEGGKYHK